jgi:hypothetical protein
MSPSIYDTAQVLRILAPQEGQWPVVDWLLSQQQPDGGWGDPIMPLYRDIPTLSAILALRQYARRKETQNAIAAGVHFLRRQAPVWSTMHVDDLPVAAEILIPTMLKQLGTTEVELPLAPYARLMEIGERKRKVLATLPMVPGVPWLHIWETSGWETLDDKHKLDPRLMDGAGSIGHSASATAAWMKAAEGQPELLDYVSKGRKYLRDAAISTGTGIPGLVPVGFPHNRFEQAFVLYALFVADLLTDDRLKGMVTPLVEDVATALRPKGCIGMSDFFLVDGDDTSAAVAVMHKLGHTVDPEFVYRFQKKNKENQKENHFIAYPGELNASPTLTARCIHALKDLGQDVSSFWSFLLERQEADGRWTHDKWNRSWLYTTFHSVIGLVGSPHEVEVRRALEAVLVAQERDGGWGTHGQANPTETSYAVLMLDYLERHGIKHPGIAPALQRASGWMLHNYRPFARPDSKVKCWISKELYRMERIDTVCELSAMLKLEQRQSKQA